MFPPTSGSSITYGIKNGKGLPFWHPRVRPEKQSAPTCWARACYKLMALSLFDGCGEFGKTPLPGVVLTGSLT
jgi:hypothetical protein